MGTFKYLPEDYNKPKFEHSKNQEANDIFTTVKNIFFQAVVAPRKEIDTTLTSFRSRTGKSPNAALTACFEIWKNTFPMYNQSAKEKLKPAFEVALNDDRQVLTISPNEQNFECNTAMEETTAEMNKILTCCHNFLGQRKTL